MKVEDDVLNTLARADTAGPSLKLTGQLDRNLYVRTNKVLEAAGGKWDKKAKAHLFPVDAANAMEQIMQTGEVTLIRTIQQDFSYFPTPPAVVSRIIALARVGGNMMLLEPSAGKGAIASVFKGIAFVHAIELLDDNVAALRELGWMDSVVQADFLTVAPTPIYDRVTMNPPFAKQADIHHVLHALGFLKPDGLLVSVMSSGVTFRDNRLTQNFRDLIRARGGEIEALPDAAFKDSGTMVRTVIVTIPGAA